MTEKQQFEAMLTRAGVVFSTDDATGELTVVAKDGEQIALKKPGAPHNLGYSGFMAVFRFTPAGLLADVGIWE